MLVPFLDLTEALEAIGAYAIDHGAGAPAELRAELIAQRPPPVRIVRVAEALYRFAGDLDGPAWALGARLADFCVFHQWSAIGQAPRGPLISGAFRRRLGEPGATAPDEDPPIFTPLG